MLAQVSTVIAQTIATRSDIVASAIIPSVGSSPKRCRNIGQLARRALASDDIPET